MLPVFRLKRNFFAVWTIFAAALALLVLAGCVISPRRTLGGGGGGTPTPTPTPTPTGSPTPTPTPGATPAQGRLYVSNSGDNSILRFDQALTASGNIPPAATIKGAATTLNAPTFITLDTAADRLFVANRTAASILIFDNISTKDGNIAPQRTISGATTALVSPTDAALDKGRDMLYVADDLQILVFKASTDTGNVAPTRTLTLTFTPSAIFIDTTNDRLFAADSVNNAVDVFDLASTLSGSVTATRTLIGAATHLATPGGILVDGSGRLVVSNASPPSITIFNNAAGVSGNVGPAAEFVGSNTGFSAPDQIVVNTAGTGTLYNADPGAARIAVFTNLSSSTGNVGPARTITGPATTLTVPGQPVGLALDTTR